jgi:phage N-6-adenine-methyltransferase
MNKDLMFSSGKDDWETPDDLFNFYNDKYEFILDAAANEVNSKCRYHLGPGGIYEDALNISWEDWLTIGNIWLNPPYSRPLQSEFVKKASYEAMRWGHGSVVTLLPARTDTKLFHDYIWNKESAELIFLKGRLKFKGAKHGAPFPSMIVIFT